MAVDFSKYNFFRRLDSRARILVIVGVIVAFLFVIYMITRLFSSGETTVGPSRVANAPQGLQSIPGGQLTPEYYRALVQANTQAAQQAQITGGSAIPTLINPGGQQAATPQCNIICSDESANVKNLLDDWVTQGKVTPEVAEALQALADQNVPVSQYAAALDQLVREGKLTPEQARALLEQYKKQHANALLQQSAQVMDPMIKAGQLPLEAANQLLTAQKNNVTPADYNAQLQGMVGQGKITPGVAQQLLSQYNQQRGQEAAKENLATIQRMASGGEITPDIAAQMTDLANRNVPLDEYAAALQRAVAAGKLTPEAAAKMLEAYRRQKIGAGPTATLNALVAAAENAAYQELSDLLKAGQITQDTANVLRSLIQSDVSLDNFKAAVNQLVQQKKLTPQIAALKIADYQKIKQMRSVAQGLGQLQANNASPADYSDLLKRLVQAGLLTPDQASQLLQEYQALSAPTATGAPLATGAGSADFAQLQQRVQAGAASGPPGATPDFSAAEASAAAQAEQDRIARIQALTAAMSSQAQQLVTAWQPTNMSHRGGAAEAAKSGIKTLSTTTSTSSSSSTTSTGAPLIKAGSILFGVLDTAVNSDYPDSPVMVTIVQGPFKGAKLLGKLVTTKGVSGQMDRVSLNFSLMNMDSWTTSKGVTAYAIDPDTARTVLASDVNYHYLKRFGAVMATSFLQGYANAILTSGSTSTTGIFGTSTTNAGISPANKIAVGLGQIGQTLGSVTQNYVNIPPTVKVDSGVGLGILFMSDIS